MAIQIFQSLLTTVLFFVTVQLSAQSFEGVVQFEITYENLPPEMAEYKSQLPSGATTTIKNHMTKMEQPLSMGMKQVTIMDNEAESGVLLMDMMGQKNAIVLDKDSREKFEEDQPDVKFEYLDEEKKIAGYECKKALMTTTDGTQDVTLEVFYTDEIDGAGMIQMSGLKGFPLQFSTTAGQFMMTYTATSVEEKPVSEEEFTIPEGYQHITLDQFRQSMGQ